MLEEMYFFDEIHNISQGKKKVQVQGEVYVDRNDKSKTAFSGSNVLYLPDKNMKYPIWWIVWLDLAYR